MVKVICIKDYDLPFEYENITCYFVDEIYDADLNWIIKDGKPDTICVYNEQKEEAFLDVGEHFDEYFKIDIRGTRKLKLNKLWKK